MKCILIFSTMFVILTSIVDRLTKYKYNTIFCITVASLITLVISFVLLEI
jgi:hypothetical protein